MLDKQCGHSYYHNCMFNHHNPLNNENDYSYYCRCVNRFKQLLQSHENKLFIMIFVNMENSIDKKYIIEFNDKFTKHTKNYRLLVIYYMNKQSHDHTFSHHDNIDFLELHTLSDSNGVNFNDNDDNIYLNYIINAKYRFI